MFSPKLSSFHESNLIAMFHKIYNIANNKNCWEDERMFLQNTTFNLNMKLDCQKIMPDLVNTMGVSLFIKNPLTEGKVTPIGLLACQGNHQAVCFLLSVGASAEAAIQGYKVGGYLSNEAKRQELLTFFTDVSAREKIDKASMPKDQRRCNLM